MTLRRSATSCTSSLPISMPETRARVATSSSLSTRTAVLLAHAQVVCPRMRDALAAYLRAELREPDLRIQALEPVPQGHSGFTYYVETGTRSYVLRVPPPGARIAGPADVVRQGRIMRSLGAAGLPVPAVPISCDDPTALDGRPFILMDRVEGASFQDAVRAHGSAAIARSTVECLRRLHAVPLASTGIGDEAPKPLAEEVTRWSQLMERGVTELTGGAGDL